MTDGQDREAAARQQLAATSRLVVAEESRQAASAAVDWLRADPAVEAAAVVLTSGTEVTHRVCRSDEASWCDLVLERLERRPSSSGAPPPASRGKRGNDEAPSRFVHAYPLRTEHRSFGTMGIGSVREQVAGDDADVTRRMLARALTSRLESLEQLSRLRLELAQTKRWFNTLDGQLRVLDRERQKLSAVVSQSDTLMLVVDAELVVRWANMAMATRLRQATGANPIGMQLESAWPALDANLPRPHSHDCPAARAFREGVPIHAESAAPVAGTTRNLYLTFLPIRSPQGETAELLIMIQDLSDLQMLRRSEARYRMLFERSPNAMIMAAPDTGRIVLANDVAGRLTGHGREGLLELTLREIHHPDDWPPAEQEYASISRNDGTLSRERRLITRSGEEMVAEVTAIPFDLDGRAVTFLELRDVTERKRLEQELRHSQKMEAVGQLAGGVAHDFNNILTVLIGEAELLAATPGLPKRVLEKAQVIGRETRRASLLTRKLLAISRKELTALEVLDLNDLLRDVEALVRPLIGDNVALHLQLCPSPCPIRADRAQLEQVVVNLAVNARDAMPDGGDFWIESALEGPASSAEDAPDETRSPLVRLTVRDDGTGMDGRTSERLFEPFFTTKPPGKGTGLGMSTVHRIVREHGGTIQVDSAPGKGSSFHIRLPLAGGDVAVRMPSNYPQPPRGTARILLVEDRPELRKLTARVLRQAGYDVVTAESGEEALQEVTSAAAPFDLLITDVVLPQMSGGRLATTVAAQVPTVQVLYISGYAEDDIVQHGVSTAQASFLSKPFSPNALVDAVRKLLDARP